MPTYEYECSECSHVFEEFQSMSAPPLELCPSCGESALRRLVGGGIGIIFKGNGFYVNDSKKNGSSVSTTNGKSANGSAAPPKTSSSAASETKSSEKPKDKGAAAASA